MKLIYNRIDDSCSKCINQRGCPPIEDVVFYEQFDDIHIMGNGSPKKYNPKSPSLCPRWSDG